MSKLNNVIIFHLVGLILALVVLNSFAQGQASQPGRFRRLLESLSKSADFNENTIEVHNLPPVNDIHKDNNTFDDIKLNEFNDPDAILKSLGNDRDSSSCNESCDKTPEPLTLKLKHHNRIGAINVIS